MRVPAEQIPSPNPGCPRHQRRGAIIAFLLVAALVWTGGLVVFGWQAIDDARGATVDAEVIGITTNVPGRRVYEVRFVTPAGRVCQSRVDSGSNPPPREIRVGGHAMVHYSASDPCSSSLLRETTSWSPWPIAVVSLVAIVVCLVVAWRLLRRTRGQP